MDQTLSIHLQKHRAPHTHTHTHTQSPKTLETSKTQQMGQARIRTLKSIISRSLRHNERKLFTFTGQDPLRIRKK
jgi:hypothetical protein